MSASCSSTCAPHLAQFCSPACEAESLARQQREWNEHVVAAHAKGCCEYSGLKLLACVRSICDCFETEEGVALILAGTERAGE